MDTIQKLVSHGRWLFGPAKRSPQWATLPVGKVCRNNSEELQIFLFFGTCWDVVSLTIDFRTGIYRDVYLLKQTVA